MRPTNIVLLATLSKGKFREYRDLFRAYPDLDPRKLDELVWNPSSFQEAETGSSYYDNAFVKARLAHFAGKYPTISDDSGLEVDALEGRPALHSRRFAEPRPGETADAANNRKLLEELRNVPREKRSARYVSTLVFLVEGVVLSATGSVEGRILESPQGTGGFGYDPLFLPDGHDKTFAELTLEEKNRISHRAKALHALMKQIKSRRIEWVRP